jgi:hypothetical protein
MEEEMKSIIKITGMVLIACLTGFCASWDGYIKSMTLDRTNPSNHVLTVDYFTGFDPVTDVTVINDPAVRKPSPKNIAIPYRKEVNYKGGTVTYKYYPATTNNSALIVRALSDAFTHNKRVSFNEGTYQFTTSDEMPTHTVKLAADIAIGPDNSVYILGTETPQGLPYRWTGSSWQWLGAGAATRITVDPKGNPWVCTSSGSLHRWNPTTQAWIQIPSVPARGTLREISFGANGCMHAVSFEAGTADGIIYKMWWDVATDNFMPNKGWVQYYSGAACKVSAEPDSTAWVRTSSNSIHRWNTATQSWEQQTGQEKELFVAACGKIYVIGANTNQIFSWDQFNKKWVDVLPTVSGGVKKLAAENNGTLWCIDNSNKVWRLMQGAWKQM